MLICSGALYSVPVKVFGINHTASVNILQDLSKRFSAISVILLLID